MHRALILIALLATTARAAELPVAVWYGGGKVRAPMLERDPASHRDEWRKDLQQIRATGFSAIRCWIDWASAEPREREYHFETLDVLTELAHETGLKVIVQVYIDSAPDWVGKKFSDAHFVSISGEVMPSESAPGYCFDHPGVHAAVLRLFTALADHLGKQPAFIGFDVWSEPHVINWAEATYMRSAEFCFCRYSVARYREWLKQRYGTLDALNRAWYRHFDSWDDVGPNRLSTILSYTDFIDWRTFIVDKLAQDLRARTDAVKHAAPDAIVASHAAAPSLFTSPLSGDGSPDDWKMTRNVDFWGTSFYPKHSFPVGRDAAWRGALLDFTRSSTNNSWWLGELQAGFGTVALRVSSTVTPDDLRTWMWSAIARGAKGINVYAWYPMSSGYESGGFGLVDLDGTITDRAKAAGAVAKAIESKRDILAGAQPLPAEIAIVYNPLSYMVGGRRPQVAATAQGEVVNVERNSMLGIYRALFPTNAPVDFIHVDELASKASRYKLIFLPYPLMLSEPAAKALAAYVKNGGALVAEARAAWNDEHGRAKEIIPGYGLNEVCGCRETAVQSTPNGKIGIEMTSDFAGLKAGDALKGSIYQETLTPTTGHAVATFADGSPAIVESTYGAGKMLTIGSFEGLAYETEHDETIARLLRGTLAWAGVQSPVTATPESIEVRILRSGDKRVFFVFNHASEPVVHATVTAGEFQFSGEIKANGVVVIER